MSTTVYLYDNVFLDKEYRNISNIRVSTSTRTPVKSYTGLTFQRVESEIINSGSPRLAGTIRLPLNNDLEILRKCGYMTFQNSGDIKYYAFIDEVNYINAGNVEIRYTIDDFQTYLTDYLNNWTDKCFVEQEHINRADDDPKYLDGSTQGVNPSSLIWNDDNIYQKSINSIDYIGLAMLLDVELKEKLEEIGMTIRVINNGRSSIMLATFNRKFEVGDIGKIIAVLSEAERYKYVVECVASAYPIYSNKQVTPMSTNFNVFPKKINSYFFKNGIMRTYPFHQFFIKSTTGESVSIKAKDCRYNNSGDLIIDLTIPAYLTKEAMVSVSPLPPVYILDKRPPINKSVRFPISATIPIQRDQLLTFLSTSAALKAASFAGSAGTAIGGALMLASGAGAAVGVPLLIGGAAGMFGTGASAIMAEQNRIEPTGNFSNDVYSLCSGMHGFDIITYSVSENEGQMLDEYFSVYGYITNKVKIPNIKNRNNFNFVKCHDISNFRGVPPRAKTAMTNAFSKGVFIWHNLGQIGNYDIDTNG